MAPPSLVGQMAGALPVGTKRLSGPAAVATPMHCRPLAACRAVNHMTMRPSARWNTSGAQVYPGAAHAGRSSAPPSMYVQFLRSVERARCRVGPPPLVARDSVA
jgi:hypothetical protein